MLKSINLSSQTIAGGEIYYKLIGNKSYEIEADIYRVCNTASLNGINGYVISDSIRIPIQFTRVTISKINDTCGNPCNVSNTVSNYGFERHTFKAFVDFNSNTYDTFIKMGMCLINFAVLENKRDPNVNTHNTGNFYIDAGVNICDTLIRQNASPRFTIDPKFKGYIGDAIRYSPGPIDTTDFDSLAFALAPVQSDYNKNINYINLFTSSIPIAPWCPPNPGVVRCKLQPNLSTPTGFYFDSIGCQIVFSPASENLGYIKFYVKEFRKINGNWHYIGFTCREMLFNSFYGSSKFNYSPNLTSIPNGPLLPVCSGNSILDIKSADNPNYPTIVFDTTYLFWNKTYKNGLFKLYDTLLDKSARIELPFNSNLIDKHQYFTVSTYDKMCNEKLVSKTFLGINRTKIPYSSSINLDSCNVFTYNIRPQDTTLAYSSEVSIFNKHKVLVDKFDKNRTYAVLIDSGLYYIQMKLTITGMNCPIFHIDTIHTGKQIPRIPFSYPRDTTVCSSYPANFSISASNLPGLNSYKWFKNDSISLIDSSKFHTIIHGNSNIVLRMYFNDGCFSEYRSNYQSMKYAENFLGNSYGGDVCPMDSFVISGYPTNDYKYKKPYTYVWSLYGNQWTTNKSPFKFQVKSETKIKVRVIDDNHCILEDSTIFYPKAYLLFDLRSDKPQNCIDSNIQFSAVNTGKFLNVASVRWIQNDTDTIVNKNFIRTIPLTSDTKMKVTMFGSGCQLSDSIVVKAIPNPKIEISGALKICSNDTSIQTLKLDPFNGNQKIEWYLNNNLIDTGLLSIKMSEEQSFQLKVLVNREDLCKSEDETIIEVVPNPTGILIGPDEICIYDSAQFELTIDTFSRNQNINWFLDSLNVESNTFSILVKKDSSYVVKSQIWRDNLCFSEFTTTTTVFRKPVFNILGDTFYHYSNFIQLKTDKQFDKYLWSDSTTNQNNEFWATTLGDPGQYSIWCNVTDSNNCVGADTITIYTNQYTGFSDKLYSQLKIFPNPTSDNLYINSTEEFEYSLIDISGRTVTTGQLIIGLNTIDLCNFSKGIYILSISGEYVKIEVIK